MALVHLNPMLTSLSGRLGGLVFYSYNKRQYARRYVIPRNPDTEKQRNNRELFSSAVKAWQDLPRYKKVQWNRKSLTARTSGYSLFLSEKLRSGRRSSSDAVLSVFSPAGLSVSDITMPAVSGFLSNKALDADRSGTLILSSG